MSKKNNKIAAKPAQTKNNNKQVKKAPAKKDAQQVIEEQAIEPVTDNIEEAVEAIDTSNEELILDSEPVEETAIEIETAETIEPVILPEEKTLPAQKEIVAEPTEKNAGKPKRKDLNFESLVGCSYHMHRKFLKKLFSKNEVVVRFVKSEVGYNGHLEVPSADKQKAIAVLETFKVDNPTIKNLYWALNLDK
jgi:hypothetical protein